MKSAANSKWRVVLDPEAKRQLEGLPDAVADEAGEVIGGLEEVAPFPPGKLLDDIPNTFTIRIHSDQYRVIYTMYKHSRTIRIIRVVRRTSKTYSGLRRWDKDRIDEGRERE